MNKPMTFVLIVSLAVAVGCQRKAKPELSEVPPPVEPVAVQDYPQPQAVQFEDVAAPQPVVSPVAVPPAQSTYTIRKNDTLWKIAQSHYGDGQRWQDIAAANPGIDPKKLAVGQTIVLP